MKTGYFSKIGLVAISAIFMTACSSLSGLKGTDGLTSRGLGGAGGFFGQEAGEMYTTQAPHNQIYLFSYDNSYVNEKYMPSLHAQAEYLKDHPGARVLIEGHTDERGSREYNIALGERRANSVADVLRTDGVSSRQIRVVSYGKERPANLGHDEDSRAQNRRAEFTYEATK
ncbi:MAG: peptidoglycan-associated lipoprotein [Legionellales bacterium RIFCSPHIGHO2_12_FULL_35_11]|nr:MAG: peptidoglycan-associated lipoprotein [Legionellales bacterium RIFCSPHIGHO2_12_FULL_35_11]